MFIDESFEKYEELSMKRDAFQSIANHIENQSDLAPYRKILWPSNIKRKKPSAKEKELWKSFLTQQNHEDAKFAAFQERYEKLERQLNEQNAALIAQAAKSTKKKPKPRPKPVKAAFMKVD